jgi:serine/threonine protein kinase
VKRLGKGTTASVYLAVDLNTGEEVALKVVSSVRKPEFLRECSFAERVTRHPSLLDIKATVKDGQWKGQETQKRVSYLV